MPGIQNLSFPTGLKAGLSPRNFLTTAENEAQFTKKFCKETVFAKITDKELLDQMYLYADPGKKAYDCAPDSLPVCIKVGFQSERSDVGFSLQHIIARNHLIETDLHSAFKQPNQVLTLVRLAKELLENINSALYSKDVGLAWEPSRLAFVVTAKLKSSDQYVCAPLYFDGDFRLVIGTIFPISARRFQRIKSGKHPRYKTLFPKSYAEFSTHKISNSDVSKNNNVIKENNNEPILDNSDIDTNSEDYTGSYYSDISDYEGTGSYYSDVSDYEENKNENTESINENNNNNNNNKPLPNSYSTIIGDIEKVEENTDSYNDSNATMAVHVQAIFDNVIDMGFQTQMLKENDVFYKEISSLVDMQKKSVVKENEFLDDTLKMINSSIENIKKIIPQVQHLKDKKFKQNIFDQFLENINGIRLAYNNKNDKIDQNFIKIKVEQKMYIERNKIIEEINNKVLLDDDQIHSIKNKLAEIKKLNEKSVKTNNGISPKIAQWRKLINFTHCLYLKKVYEFMKDILKREKFNPREYEQYLWLLEYNYKLQGEELKAICVSGEHPQLYDEFITLADDFLDRTGMRDDLEKPLKP